MGDSAEQRLDKARDAAAFEAQQVLFKLFRGNLDAKDPGVRLTVNAAITSVASRARERQSERAARHSNFAMAGVLADNGLALSEAVALTMPDDPIAHRLAAIKALEAGDA